MLPVALALVIASTPGAALGPETPALVRAADAPTHAPSPRRLFNLGLGAEEVGDGGGAVARYMAAGLVPRSSFADALYARGAALRLIRFLAGRDDDAAAAVATLLSGDDEVRPGTELSPLLRSLLVRVEQELVLSEGILSSVRLDPHGGAILEILDGSGGARVVHAPAPVAPFSAGDGVRFLARQGAGGATELVALGAVDTGAWRLLAVRGLGRAGAVVSQR
jgi:hypothetical protein